MVTTKIGKGDIFGQNLPVQQDQNAFGKCSEYSEIQAGRFLQNEIKKTSPAFSSSPIPSQNTVLGCPVPCSTIRETCHSSLWQGFCVETFIFLCFFSKCCHNKIFSAPVRVPSLQPAFSTAPISVVRILCRCYLFQMYIKAIQPCNGLCSVMCCCHLSLLVSPVCFPCGMSQLSCRPSEERDCPFYVS